jgi:hypothetical protein
MFSNHIFWEIIKHSDIYTILKLYKINRSFYNFCNQYRYQFIKILFYQSGYINLMNFSYFNLFFIIKKLGVYNLEKALITDYDTLGKYDFTTRKFFYNNIISYNCSGCNLYSLPIMPNLRILNCSLNKLTYIHNYPKLEVLICNYNLIYFIALKNNNRLKKLSCNSNFLKRLPELNHCEYLDCSENYISKLPKLPKIKYLNCFYN